MTTCAPAAVPHSRLHGETPVSARLRAMPPTGKETAVNKELTEKVVAYRTAMAVIAEMLKEGIITADDYGVIDTKMAEKYGLKSSTIFAEFDLISVENNGNI